MLLAAIVVAIVLGELWILLAAIALIALAAFALWSLANGDWWWN